MVNILTATGREITADALIKSRIYPSVYIYTNQVSEEEAKAIFSDSNEATRLTGFSLDTGESVTYDGYTELFAVLPAELYAENPGELLIWLNRKEALDASTLSYHP